MIYKVNVSGLTYCVLKSTNPKLIFKPDSFTQKQLRLSESMNLQSRRTKLNYTFNIDLNFDIESSSGIGIILHETHLREMKSFVDGYKHNGSKRKGVTAFFDKYDIFSEYSSDSAYRYIISHNYVKVIDKSQQIPSAIIPVLTQPVTPKLLLSKIAENFELQNSFFKKMSKSKKDVYISYLSYYLLYEFSDLNQIQISEIFNKHKANISRGLYRFRRLLCQDESIQNDILKILS